MYNVNVCFGPEERDTEYSHTEFTIREDVYNFNNNDYVRQGISCANCC